MRAWIVRLNMRGTRGFPALRTSIYSTDLRRIKEYELPLRIPSPHTENPVFFQNHGGTSTITRGGLEMSHTISCQPLAHSSPDTFSPPTVQSTPPLITSTSVSGLAGG